MLVYLGAWFVLVGLEEISLILTGHQVGKKAKNKNHARLLPTRLERESLESFEAH